jgi:hypothetical protein
VPDLGSEIRINHNTGGKKKAPDTATLETGICIFSQRFNIDIPSKRNMLMESIKCTTTGKLLYRSSNCGMDAYGGNSKRYFQTNKKG